MVFAKSQVIHKHTDSSTAPTTVFFLDNGGAATSVGVFSYIVSDTTAKIVNFVLGDICIANDALRSAISRVTGMNTNG